MKKIKAIAIISALAIILSSVIYLSINSRMESAVAAQVSDTEESEYNRPLCERLIRFGQVAYERGQIAEAKQNQPEPVAEEPAAATQTVAEPVAEPVAAQPAAARPASSNQRRLRTIDELRLDGSLQLPELHLDTAGQPPEATADQVVAYLRSKGKIP